MRFDELFSANFEPFEDGYLYPTTKGRKKITAAERDGLDAAYAQSMSFGLRDTALIFVAMIGLIAFLVIADEIGLSEEFTFPLMLVATVATFFPLVWLKLRKFYSYKRGLALDARPAVGKEEAESFFSSRLRFFKRLSWPAIAAIVAFGLLLSFQLLGATSREPQSYIFGGMGLAITAIYLAGAAYKLFAKPNP